MQTKKYFSKWCQNVYKLGLFFFTVIVLMTPLSVEAESKLKFYKNQGGDFTLTGHHGNPVSLLDYRGKVVLLTFGYTHCPDVCPLIMSYLQQVAQRLGKQVSDVQTIFVSFDPERDTLEQLKNYISHFHPSFLGLTGTPEEIKKVARQYRAAYFKQNVKSAAGYLYAHTDYIYLIDQQGQLRRIYRKTPLNKIVEDIQYLIAHNN